MLNELEVKRIERALEVLKRPRIAPHVMSGGIVEHRINGHEVLLFTTRLRRGGDDGEQIELPIAKFKFVKTQALWHLYWQRASGKWQSYEPFSVAKHFDDLVDEVLRDPYGCFWG